MYCLKFQFHYISAIHRAQLIHPFITETSPKMSSPGGIFKARQFGTESASKRSFLADSTLDSVSYHPALLSTYSRSELTKNDNYCVSRLPALPPILNNDHMNDDSCFLNGYADGKTEFALVVSEKSINVWPYNSSDDVPISFEFPLGESSKDALQLAILTRSSPGTSLDPGLVIVNSTTGHVRFYESVQHAPALGMINSKSIETKISILETLGEYITLVENVEPAGIVVATSWKRVVLILLRDHKGAPKLTTLELTRPSTTSRFFSSWMGSRDDELTDEIVSLKASAPSHHGTQDIIVQDAAGTFKKYVFQASSTGMPIINYKKTLLYRLATYLESNIDGFIPGSVVKVKFLDLWPAFCGGSTNEASDLYIALVCVQSSLQNANEERLALLTMKINDSGVMMIGSHQLPQTRHCNNISLVSKPKLFIPKPGSSAFVIIDNAVILCDLRSDRPNPSEVVYYKPKWEDTIKFKPSVQVIGCGYEDKAKDDKNPALIFITSDFGVVRIERFDVGHLSNKSLYEDATNPVNILKSHIEQAIYFSESPFLDFNVGSNFSEQIISEAVRSVTAEIMNASSSYLPPYFSSTRDSFTLRLKLLGELIDFVKNNFQTCWINLQPVIVEVLEKIEVSLKLWNLIDSDELETKALKTKFRDILTQKEFRSLNSQSDVLREYFEKDVSGILDVLTRVIEDNHQSQPLSIQLQLRILLLSLHDGVYLNELQYIVPNQNIAPRKLWIFDTSLILQAEELVSKAYCAKDSTLIQSTSHKEEFVKLVATLYYLISSAVIYMKINDDDQLLEYTNWFERRRTDWIQSLLENGLLREALVIAERYKDFSSVARVLEKERELSSPEYILDKVSLYMQEYGYEFACKLFEFDVKQDRIQRLLVEYNKYEEYLTKFFDEYSGETGIFSWIYHLQYKRFEKASNVLISVAGDEHLRTQQSREFCYSMAKLSAIAAEAQGTQSTTHYALEELAIEAENNLVVVRIQNKIYQYISQFVQGKKDMITLEYFLESFINPRLSKSDTEKQVAPFFESFVDQKVLTKRQLITLLTVLNPVALMETIFADALTVAALINNDAIFQELARQVWAKVLVNTDNWSFITATGDNTDEVNKLKIHDSILYHTMKGVKGNGEILSVLDMVIGEDNKVMRSLHDKVLADKLRDLKLEFDVRKWVTLARAEA